jgi:carbon-monoxide dehydrogenase iron sulfur subunit
MKRLYVIKEKCNGCMSCVVACQKAHAHSELYAPIRESEPARIYIQTVLNAPIPLACHHCEEPACVRACMSGAMQKDEVTGIVSNEGNAQQCVGCWMCVMVCPSGALKTNPEHHVVAKCDLCAETGERACAEACPTGALKPRKGGGVLLEPEKCIGCRKCIDACIVGAVNFDEDLKIPIICKHCGICAQFCPHQCLTMEEV